jgi:Rieske Fe-S protein
VHEGDPCRRGLLRAAVAGAVSLAVSGCGGEGRDERRDGGTSDANVGGLDAASDGAGERAVEAGACVPTCAAAGASTLTFLFSDYPQLQTAGGSAVGRAAGYADPACGMDVVIVALVSPGSYVAFSAACTHQCCTVGYDKAVSEFVCPCHGSTYDKTGRVTGGPAPSDLTPLQVCVDACGVHVTYA